MGIDAVVTFDTKSGEAPDHAWVFFERRKSTTGVGGRFVVDMGGQRFWSPGYRRGNWPKIAAVLLELMADPNISDVWYHGDSGGQSSARPFTLDDFVEYSREWVRDPGWSS